MHASDRTKALFKFDPERSVASIIKAGVLEAFFYYINKGLRSEASVRKDIVHALLCLEATALDPQTDKIKRITPQRDTKNDRRFFSASQDALVEIYRDEATDTLGIEHFTVPQHKSPHKTESQRQNAQFKLGVAEGIRRELSVTPNVVVETILTGVYFIFLTAEDFAGPFVEQFAAQRVLFGDLSTVYEKAKKADMVIEKGCYSFGIAVDEALGAIEGTRDARDDEDKTIIMGDIIDR